jgi:hypothetical protein
MQANSAPHRTLATLYRMDGIAEGPEVQALLDGATTKIAG